MRRYLQSEAGITLVELLAAISIASLLLILVTSVHLFIQNQSTEQKNQTDQTNQLSYVFKLITNDFRKAQGDIDVIHHQKIRLGDVHYIWDEVSSSIYKDDLSIIDHVTSFSIEEDENMIHLEFIYADEEKSLTLTKREERGE